jgi:hypothetical protein
MRVEAAIRRVLLGARRILEPAAEERLEVIRTAIEEEFKFQEPTLSNMILLYLEIFEGHNEQQAYERLKSER